MLTELGHDGGALTGFVIAGTLASRFRFRCFRGVVAGDAALVDVDHVGKTENVCAVLETHTLFYFLQAFTTHFAHSHLNHFAVPNVDLQIVREKFRQSAVALLLVAACLYDFNDVVRIDTQVQAKKAIKSLAEVSSVGFWEASVEMLFTFGEKAGQVKKSARVRDVGGGEIREDDSRGSQRFFVFHGALQ